MSNMQVQSNQKHGQSAKRFGSQVPTIFDLFNRPLSDFSFFGNHEALAESFAVDIRDCGDHYELKADLAGVKKEDIKLDFEDGVLTIRAEHNRAVEENQDDYVIRERCHGTFERAFRFEDVDPAQISAAFNDGELTISVPKSAKASRCSIEIG